MKEKQNPNLLHVYVHVTFLCQFLEQRKFNNIINTMNLLDVLMAIVKY